jgi:hypothetical protein
MLRRPFIHRYNHLLRHSLLRQSSRPVFRATHPLQSRFFTRRPAYKGDHPLWFIATSIISFVGFFYWVKKKRGLGSNPQGVIIDIDPMNQNPTDDVRKEDAHKLPVLQKDGANPLFSREHVHVIFVLGPNPFILSFLMVRRSRDRKRHAM